ncbi:MAG: hypothetical protein E7673_05285 [Ruminococcaceae bacterium]|nr:hypothetical protein [Oscillospiraceae bacterium]
MIGAILSLFAALIIFLILTESLTINLKYGENYIIKIGFMVFAIVFTSNKSSKKQNNKSKKKQKKNARFWISLIKIILPKSSVKIRSFALSLPEKDPDKNAISYGIYSGLISSAITFFEANTKFFEVADISISYSEHNSIKKQIEAELNISLIDFLISLAYYPINSAYNRLLAMRKRKANERKQNERYDKSIP